MASSEPIEGVVVGDSPFSKPDHPDIKALEEIVIEYLTPREGREPDDMLRESLVLLADPRSASYVATQRAIGFLGITDPQELQVRAQEVASIAVFWLDGFISGGHLERGRHERQIPEGEEKI